MITYKDAGVDPARAEKVLKNVKGIGGFGAVIPIDGPDGLEHIIDSHVNPYWQTGCKLVMGTDGVGTKVKIAEKLKRFDTIGIDLVAMCVNDVICHGATPFAFLDYYATGKLRVRQSIQILSGIQTGCEIANCQLVGGETAEMPGVYTGSKFDLAGFCVGVVHIQNERPLIAQSGWHSQINAGDLIVGIPSSGFHSNGYSLIRKCYDGRKMEYPEHLLTPTRIYVKDVIPQISLIKGLAHITGGGIHGNLPRTLPDTMTYDLDLPKRPQIFDDIKSMADITDYELECTFNCGWGMMLVINEKSKDDILKHVKDAEVLGCVSMTNE